MWIMEFWYLIKNIDFLDLFENCGFVEFASLGFPICCCFCLPHSYAGSFRFISIRCWCVGPGLWHAFGFSRLLCLGSSCVGPGP